MKRILKIFPIIFILVLVGIAYYIYNIYKSSIYSPSPINTPTVFTIQDGETVDQIGQELAKDNLIQSTLTFKIYVRMHNLTDSIKSGMYKIKPHSSAQIIVSDFEQGTFYKFVVISPGSRTEQVSEDLDATLSQGNDQKQFSTVDFKKEVNNPSLFANKYSFISYIPKGKPLEGFLYNGNYIFPKDETAEQSINSLLSSFDSSVMHNIDQGQIGKNGLTFYQDIVLASIVDKEASGTSQTDRRMIADIFIRRLNQGISLGSDPTVEYALGYSDSKKTWWNADLTEQDLQIDSPYNTRLYKGLPPTPIDSPDVSSINAVLNPLHNNYLYFFSDSKSVLHYSTTLQEHDALMGKYL